MYLHRSLQYKVRHDILLGENPEIINAVFVEKNETNTKHSIYKCLRKLERLKNY